MTASERDRVLAEARTWVGTPYHHNAAVKGAGADCALMPLSVYRSQLPSLPQIPAPKYLPQWHLHRSEELYLDYVRALGCKEISEPEPGDFVLYRVGRKYSHGAIVLAWPQIIHAVIGCGVIYADALSEPRLARAARLYFTL